jgi:regulator of sirC expression with transglutaminase-like and TPR domain
MKPSQEQALITLLGDDDERAQQLIEEKLIALGSVSMSTLFRALASPDPVTHRNAQRILRRLCQSHVNDEFLAFCRSHAQDLERGVFLLAHTAYPEVEMGVYAKRIDDMAKVLRSRLRKNDSSHTTIEKINRFLFREQGFRGNEENYYDPDNSFLNRVIDRRLGIPITLSTLYLLVAERLQLPIVGVGMPGHFILKYRENDSEFFIDPFNDGMIMDAEDCQQVIEHMGQRFDPSLLKPTGPRQMLARMCANLMHIYRERQESSSYERIEKFLEALMD